MKIIGQRPGQLILPKRGKSRERKNIAYLTNGAGGLSAGKWN